MSHILAICGSLRQKSTNKTLLEAAARLAPKGMAIALYEGLDQLPHFNPDLLLDPFIAPSVESAGIQHSQTVAIGLRPMAGNDPAEVVRLKQQIQHADGLLISSPEYAHGVPGSLKNALDWLVSGSEIVGKPVALWDASTRSSYAQESLAEILKTMSVQMVPEAFVSIPLLGKKLSVEEIVGDPKMSAVLRKALTIFERTIRSRSVEWA